MPALWTCQPLIAASRARVVFAQPLPKVMLLPKARTVLPGGNASRGESWQPAQQENDPAAEGCTRHGQRYCGSRQLIAMQQENILIASAGVEPGEGRCRESGFEGFAVVADLDDQQAVRFQMLARAAARMARVRSSPSSPLASASSGSRRYSSGRVAIAAALT
jgi:hypothetical protein